jgi:hypothetical protein
LTARGKEIVVGALLIIGIITLFSGGAPWHLIGWQKTPGSFFEKRSYKAKLYVFVNENSKSSKNYKLPAEISRHPGCYEEYEDDGGCVSLNYFLTEFTWPDGGYADFDECIVGLSHSSSCTDTDGKKYEITLTSEKAN